MRIDRRGWLLGLGAPALAATTAWSQERRVPRRIGVLTQTENYVRFDEWKAFVDEMAHLGHVADRSVEYVHRSAGVDTEPELSRRLRQAARELVQLKVDVLYIVEGDVALRAARAEASSIPIVVDRFYLDPVERGHVASLGRPGGNVTGNAVLFSELEAKEIELLVETVGTPAKLALLDPSHLKTWSLYALLQSRRQDLARALGVSLAVHSVDRVEELEPLLAQLKRDGVRAVKFDDPEFFVDRRAEVAKAFNAARMPAVSVESAYVRAGLLLAFGWDVEAIARRSAAYVDRILHGQRPQDLPIEQVSRFKLSVNLATARAIGVKVPRAILARADEVVQ